MKLRFIKVPDCLWRALSETYDPIPNIPRSDKKAKLFRPNSTKLTWFLKAFSANSLAEGKDGLQSRPLKTKKLIQQEILLVREKMQAWSSEDLRHRRNSSKLKCRFTMVFLIRSFPFTIRSIQKRHIVPILLDIIFRELIKIIDVYEIVVGYFPWNLIF